MRRNVLGKRDGFILLSAYIFILLFTGFIVVLSIRQASSTAMAMVSQRENTALYLAQAGIERVKTELYNNFMEYFYDPNQGAWTEASFGWFDNLLGESAPYSFPVTGSLGSGSYSVQLVSVEDDSDGLGKVITLLSTGTSGGVQRSVRVALKFDMAPSPVFNYAYFVNNLGWFWGSTITANGDVRSNGDFSLRYDPKVNGNVYAGMNPELPSGSTGEISGSNRFDSLSDYYSSAPDRARPGNPSFPSEDLNGNGVLDPGEDVNSNGVLDLYEYENGYDGSSTQYPYQNPIPMPYLGDLDDYKDIATTNGGKIEMGGSTVVDGVYEGNLILVGTDSNPIELNGPVVVTGDVVIKGKVSGQGVIYAGRNVHIVGNIEYKNPPSWPKPESDMETVDSNNSTKDFLGLAAKGNIVIGDYTSSSWNYPQSYLHPPMTRPYKVDPTDAVNGYISYYDGNGDPYFNGDYVAFDGGKKEDGSNRRYYESSFRDSTIHNLSDYYSNITHIDAFMYTNHALTGRIGRTEINGGVVARDEAIIYSGSLVINYDVRIKDKTFRENFFYLPRDISEPEVLSWEIE